MAANNTATTTNSSGGERPALDIRLRKAASCGDSMLMHSMVSKNPDILLGTTQQGNNCLHIASIHGHERFCKDVVELNESLLSDANLYAETPLIVALTRGHPSLARIFLTHCHKVAGLRQSIFQQDNNGCNALHHAIRIGREELALDLIAAEPALSEAVNKFNESPLFLAVMRDFNHVFEELLQLPGSAHVGQFGFNALHAAVRNNNPAIARKIMQTRPWLAREGNTGSATPIRMAVYCNKICVLRELLQQDCSMGYEMHRNSSPLLICAAERGHVDVARELLQHCPDAPYCKADKESQTCLHIAVLNNRIKFVEFILGTPHLRKLVNMQDSLGKTALHYAVQKCYPEIVSALLSHQDIDTSILDNKAKSAARELCITPYSAKTINWVCYQH
uniref:Uncharacterized protein n=1 Tax=Avena sativa TaxID=4498 RepID=A0ACD5WNP1_AVESA